jgi:mannose-6-phosphate isomerase
MKLYPLKFTPIPVYRMWGGNKLNTHLNKGFKMDQVGESWEISGVNNYETVVSEGNLSGKTLLQLAHDFKQELLGTSVYDSFGTQFPLLIKFIDAKTPLSIQVHPHDDVAKVRHNSFGKNEMWYVMEADKDAEIIVGFNTKLDQDKFLEYSKNDQILSVLNSVKTKTGDAFYIPTGRIHAIGEGVMLAEIQQTSDITYRIYDYNRVDSATGNQRELHNDLAIDILDFDVQKEYKTQYSSIMNQSNVLIHTPYFKTNIITLSNTIHKDYSGFDSFILFICTKGSFIIATSEKKYKMSVGETILIPACITHLDLIPDASSIILEVYI